MKYHIFPFYLFSEPESAVEVARRMGWEPDVTPGNDAFSIFYHNEDSELVNFIFGEFM